MRCYSAYLDMRFLQSYFRPTDFQKLVNESKQLTAKSNQNCVLCKRQLALHFIGKNIQIESCYPCQKVWFESEDLQKFQRYTHLRNEGKTIHFQDGSNDVPLTTLLFDSTYNHSSFLTRPSSGLLINALQIELATNYVGNKITDTNFFKKYPVLTFFLVVAVVVIYFIITRD